MTLESTSQHERAMTLKSTIFGERAKEPESTKP
jgi:hypothetical protein